MNIWQPRRLFLYSRFDFGNFAFDTVQLLLQILLFVLLYFLCREQVIHYPEDDRYLYQFVAWWNTRVFDPHCYRSRRHTYSASGQKIQKLMFKRLLEKPPQAYHRKRYRESILLRHSFEKIEELSERVSLETENQENICYEFLLLPFSKDAQ